MPIEIRELHIKAVIDGSKGGEPGSKNTASGQGNDTSSQNRGNMDAIIEACVEKVMELLKEKRER